MVLLWAKYTQSRVSLAEYVLVYLSGMAAENQTDNLAWPFSVLFGWSVEWDPSLAGNDPPE
jgi:hypothetical protein